MAHIAKAQSLQMKLKSNLEKRLAVVAPTWSVSEDSSKGIVLLIQDNLAAIQMIVRIQSMDTQFQNSIQQSQIVYSPSLIQVIEDTTVASIAVKNLVEFELAVLGVKQERYTAATPALSQLELDGTVSSATKIQDLSDLKWPLSGQ